MDRSLHIVVTAASGISACVFVWQRAASSAQGDNGKDKFVGVATPSDLEDIPENSPDVANEMPYYRTDDVELWFRNDNDYTRYRALILSQINDLVRKVNSLEATTVEEVVTFPTAIPDVG